MLAKSRLNRRQEDTTLDDYLTARLWAVIRDLERNGIYPKANDSADLIHIVDMAVEQYLNRDKAGNGNAMPEWLRMWRRERWLAETSAEVENDDT